MSDLFLWTVFVCVFSEIASQVYEFEAPCCNGTLGYAHAFGKMPCSALKCCNSSETVSVAPINAALGYVFRCVNRSENQTCTERGKVLIDTNEEGIRYGDRVCCKGLNLQVAYNTPDAAFAVKCVDSLR